jgi:hypothetical protein
MTRRLDDDVLVEAEMIAQREQLGLRRVARRVLPLRRVGKLLARSKNVTVRVDRTGRDREGRLRR